MEPLGEREAKDLDARGAFGRDAFAGDANARYPGARSVNERDLDESDLEATTTRAFCRFASLTAPGPRRGARLSFSRRIPQGRPTLRHRAGAICAKVRARLIATCPRLGCDRRRLFGARPENCRREKWEGGDSEGGRGGEEGFLHRQARGPNWRPAAANSRHMREKQCEKPLFDWKVASSQCRYC